MEFVATLAATECGAFSEIALLGGSVIVGWFFSTLLLAAVERRAKLQKKSVGCDLRACRTRELSDEEAHTESDNSECFDEPERSEQPRASAQELFEAYGLFGAAAGAWSRPPAQGVLDVEDFHTEPAEGELADVEDEPERGYDVPLAAPDLSARESVASLWEQYEIFGSAPGKWSLTSASTAWSEGASTAVSEDEAEPSDDELGLLDGDVRWSRVDEIWLDGDARWSQVERLDEAEPSDDELELLDGDVRWSQVDEMESDTIWNEPFATPKQPPDGSALAEIWEHYGLFAAPVGAWS